MTTRHHPSQPTLKQTQPVCSIIVIGEALVDCFPDGDVVGGAPFNLARNLGAFGAAPLIITRIGNDDLGAALRAEFDRFNLSCEGLQHDATRPTGRVDVVIADTGHTFAIADNVAWDFIDPIEAAAVTRRTQPTIVCFGALAQRTPASRTAIAAVLEPASDRRVLRVLDLNLRSAAMGNSIADIAEWSLCHADIAKVNDDELAQLIDWFVPDAASAARDWGSIAHLDAITQLMNRFPLRNLIVTRGSDGYTAFDASGTTIASGKPAAIRIVDTVGAGDAFTAIVVLGETLRWPLTLALARANDFASAVCTLRGAVADNIDFYQRWAESWQLQSTVGTEAFA